MNQHRVLVRAIERAEAARPSEAEARAALERLEILIAAAQLSEAGQELSERWLGQIRAVLEMYAT